MNVHRKRFRRYLILAEMIDRIGERDEILRATVGVPDRSASTGTNTLPVACNSH